MKIKNTLIFILYMFIPLIGIIYQTVFLINLTKKEPDTLAYVIPVVLILLYIGTIYYILILFQDIKKRGQNDKFPKNKK